MRERREREETERREREEREKGNLHQPPEESAQVPHTPGLDSTCTDISIVVILGLLSNQHGYW